VPSAAMLSPPPKLTTGFRHRCRGVCVPFLLCFETLGFVNLPTYCCRRVTAKNNCTRPFSRAPVYVIGRLLKSGFARLGQNLGSFSVRRGGYVLHGLHNDTTQPQYARGISLSSRQSHNVTTPFGHDHVPFV